LLLSPWLDQLLLKEVRVKEKKKTYLSDFEKLKIIFLSQTIPDS